MVDPIGDFVAGSMSTEQGDFIPGVTDSPASLPMGFPEDNQSSAPPPGFETTTGSVAAPPQISTIDSLWNTIKQDSQSTIAWTEQEASNTFTGAKNLAKSAVSGVESAGSGAVDFVESGVKSVYWYTILAVVVIGGVIYFAGKSGAIKVNAIV